MRRVDVLADSSDKSRIFANGQQGRRVRMVGIGGIDIVHDSNARKIPP